MEDLKRLEKVERVIRLMESSGVVAPSIVNHHSMRFLANLVLLLVEPSGDLDLNAKCSLISEHIPKISGPFLEQASSLLFNSQVPIQVPNKRTGREQSVAGNYGGLLEKDLQDLTVVGYSAMQRANSTLEDFCRSYFMFHGLDINCPQVVFSYLPVLSFTESYIYQMDNLNEEMINMSTNRIIELDRRFEMEANEGWITEFMAVFRIDPFRPLVSLLEDRNLLTERIRAEFRCGKEYWTLERKLCSALINHAPVSVEDVTRAIHLKSFDYRLLNLILYQLRGQKVNELHMEFLSISEFLVEVADDLFDYEDDVLENNFNILRMFVGVFGPSTAPVLLAKYISEAEAKYEKLMKSLDPQLALNYQRRCEDATREGGKVSGYSLGTWNIPSVIVDEELYRSNCLNCKSCSSNSSSCSQRIFED